MPALRPLPSRPSLEYARKEAKALLRDFRSGTPAAVERAERQGAHPRATRPAEVRLADAQLVVAREHGFASWARLARYLADVERQQRGYFQVRGEPRTYEARAVNLIAQHRARSIAAGRILAAYVPRFYGETVEAVLASDPVTEEEARLAVARLYGAPSWEMLVERLARESRSVVPDGPTGPMRQAARAMEAGDLGALETIVAEHPALLEPSANDLATGHTLTHVALGIERHRGLAAMQPVFDWLATRGFDRRSELGRRLCGHMRMSPDEVQSLLEQGADPNWVAPNGIPALEHALIRYWNGEAVDVLARHATARDALWVAAGLGDLSAVRRFLSRDGRPSPTARENRPDWIAVGAQGGPPPLPDPDDDEILLEAMLVAMLNGRTAVLEYVSSSSAAINSIAYGEPLINLAVANRMAPVVECFVRCGANLDLHGIHTRATARELARREFEQSPDDNACRRIALACGINVGESSRGDKG
jgi:hypothetical protein